MRRYSQAFLIAGLFCFLFPFTAITPAPNSGARPLTGWDQLSSQNIAVSKQPPLILNIPLRLPVLIAVICGAVAVLAKLSRRSGATVIVAIATTAATLSLLTIIGSSPVVQLTDGQNVVHLFESPGVQFFPAFYISLVLMSAAAATSWMNLEREQSAQYNAKPTFVPARVPAAMRSAGTASPNSFCIKCGDGLLAGARFCNRCGTPVVAVPPMRAMEPPDAIAAIQVQRSVQAVTTGVAPAPATQPVASITPAPAPTPRSAPAAPCGNAPAIASIPAPHPRFSAGAKLGLAAASLVFVTGIWFAFQPSTDNSASMSAPTSISISPAMIRVVPGQTVQLQAVVTGGMNREVQWSIQEGTPGGSVQSAGATVQNGTVFMMANYTAPALPGLYHVQAISSVDQSRKAVVQVLVGYGFSRQF